MRKLALFCAGLMLCCVQLRAQTTTLSGVVTDSKDGSPLAGVTVTASGTKTGTKTDNTGKYSITVPAGTKTLYFTSVGYGAFSKSVTANATVLDIVLTTSVTNLDEVIVFGYGTQKKKEVNGTVSSIKGEVVATKPIQTFDQALAGRAAGVQITVANGVLNSPPVFRIRGTNSISLSSYPLIVVDGIPTFTGDVSATNAAGNALGSINPSDIESIDIAKDAAATALYGSRAANGVVFITTKKGKVGKVKVNYNGWLSSSQPYRLPELLNTEQYLAFKTSAVANNPSASTIKYNPAYDANNNVIDTRWSDYVYRKGISHSHNINVSGGSEATTYYLSLGYTDQEGILKGNDFKRMNGLFNIDSRVNKVLTIGGKLAFSNEANLSAGNSGSLSGSAYATGGLGRLSFVLPPILTPYNNDGSYSINGAAIGSPNISGISNLSYYNPVPILDLNRGNSENNHIQSDVYLQLRPFKGLTLKSVYGIDYMLVDNDIFWTPVTGDGYSYNGYAWAGTDKYKRWVWTNTAQYDITLGSKHNISALIGNEQQRQTTAGYGINRQNLSDPAYDVVQAGFTINNPANLYKSENYLLSTFGRLNYNYAGKYFISGNLRQDEYSAFGEKKGVFWGASVAWDVAKEGFWQSGGLGDVFSSLKLRGSYGKVGNSSGIGDFAPYSTFGSGLYGGVATLSYSTVGNSDIKWETSNKTDVGIFMGFFRDRLTTEVTYYNNDVNGLILNVPQAPSAGLPTSPPANIGTMYNKGVEITLNATPVVKGDFSWNTNFNITFNKNEVSSLAPGVPFLTTSTSSLETVNRSEPGYSLGYIWAVRTGGVDPETGKRIFISSNGTPVYYQYYVPTGQYAYSTTSDGATRYVSPSGATAISQAGDAVMYANSMPKYYGGFDNTFAYKGFELNVLTTFQGGFYVYYGSNSGLHDQRWWNNDVDVLTDAWTTKGDKDKKYARPVYSDNVSNGSSMPLDMNVFKGDFIKFKNVTLAYTVPARITNRAKMSNFRIYASAQNLGIITDYPGPDPEVSSNGNTNTAQGVDRNTSANARTFVLGLNIGF